MPEIIVKPEYCKACGLCLIACKKNVLELGEKTNSMGYHAVVPKRNEDCIACKLCAEFCPEAAIEIYK